MCGIAGKYSLRGEPVSGNLIEKMCDKIAYRGPDDSGVSVFGHTGLGHRRLSIIDLSTAGRQPMASTDGKIWLTFNGEIYNFQDLRKKLLAKGYMFKSSTDSEVLINLFREYGTDCLEHLRGMFAFAIYDMRSDKLFLARDRIGKKPLFYCFDGNSFIFASEIKSILVDPKVPKEINYQALYDYFKYLYVPAPKTIYKNIFKLEPGQHLICSRSGIEIKQYWDIKFHGNSGRSEERISNELLQVLEESVKLRMVSDVPIGAFLSGGIDSSAVVALMSRQNGKSVTTCSIGFHNRKFDEVHFARTIANQFQTDHREFTVHENLTSNLAQLAYHFDEPFADSSAVPTYFVSKLARQAVTVALAGDGGDENFAGYEKYYMDDIENRLRNRIPKIFRKLVFPSLTVLLGKGMPNLLKKGASLARTLSHEADYGFYITNTEIPNKLWQRLANDECLSQIGDYDPFSVTAHYYHKADCEDHLTRILYTDLKTYLPGDILVKVDRMSMANSLEVRAPILDHHVIEFAANIPPELKYKQGEKKYILKQTFQDLLPHDILYRRKMGFSVPLAEWLRKDIKDFAFNAMFAPKAGLRHFFNMPELQKLWESHQTGKRNYATLLWSFFMFELWYQQFLS
ncbi:MAG: asparagine synthase (glutamine-hydrolyzing) [bacterium]